MTVKQGARRMAARQRAVDREFRQTARGIAISARKFTRDRLTQTVYAIPEDVTPSTGHKKWRRTGALRQGEEWERPDPYTIVIVNRVPYARPRHEAGKPGHRNINPVRESHWRDELVETFRPIVQDLYHETQLAVLRKTGD